MRLLIVCFLIGIKFCDCDILEKRKQTIFNNRSEGQRKIFWNRFKNYIFKSGY